MCMWKTLQLALTAVATTMYTTWATSKNGGVTMTVCLQRTQAPPQWIHWQWWLGEAVGGEVLIWGILGKKKGGIWWYSHTPDHISYFFTCPTPWLSLDLRQLYSWGRSEEIHRQSGDPKTCAEVRVNISPHSMQCKHA